MPTKKPNWFKRNRELGWTFVIVLFVCAIMLKLAYEVAAVVPDGNAPIIYPPPLAMYLELIVLIVTAAVIFWIVYLAFCGYPPVHVI
jgi:hypothetical protein